MVTEEEIGGIMEKYSEEAPKKIAWQLMKEAMKNGGKDNITAVVLKAE